jgi:aminopeptidase N
VSVAALGSDGARTASARLRVLADRTPLEFDAAAAVSAGGVVVPDAADETWAKVILSDAEWQRMAGVLGRIADPHTRVAIWNALQLAVSDAEVPPALAVDVVVAALPAELDDAVISQVSRWAIRRLAGCYLTDATRVAALARIAGAMLTVTSEAAAGSGRQLAAARAWIAATTESARLRAWLSDQQLPDGLLVDTELRWAVLRRLAVLGKLDDAAIAEEAARDRSSQGAVHATRCRAALPDPQAKQAAWDTMMHDPKRPNYELYALAEGFWDPDQRDLTGPYVGRYFEEIPATAALRSGWVVARLAELAYPWTAVEPATVDATERLLADDRLDSGIRRSVSDAGDDLRSAVAVRDRFVP